MKEWLTAKEAREYYGISNSTMFNWRKLGLFELKENYEGNRFGYLYKRDEELKNNILERKKIDNRWTK